MKIIFVVRLKNDKLPWARIRNMTVSTSSFMEISRQDIVEVRWINSRLVRVDHWSDRVQLSTELRLLSERKVRLTKELHNQTAKGCQRLKKFMS